MDFTAKRLPVADPVADAREPTANAIAYQATLDVWDITEPLLNRRQAAGLYKSASRPIGNRVYGFPRTIETNHAWMNKIVSCINDN
ncbi:hypothetical protein DQ393_11845 [Rhizobium tropici]|uniref:Uncharacterized protein n=1 Tax=Rhizobium tropici TaxID=398 RepID=A0A329YDH4_RHITR|nr:hypothetical protein DQ393_11845 [Rhizobium tropici]